MFQNVQKKRIGRNKFDLSHEVKMTASMAKLYPFYIQETVPGDKIRINSEIFIRFAPMLAPVMHRIDVYTHYFFVPNRLVWDEWEDFITGGRQGDLEPAWPSILIEEATKGWANKKSLADYMGIPIVEDGVTVSQDMRFSALPFRAYQLIYNEYYQDQNLMDEITISKASGSVDPEDLPDLMALRTKCWEKDYFTSALPWAQRGDPANMPLEPIYRDVATVTNGAGQGPAPNQNLSVADGVGNLSGDTTGPAGIQNIEEMGFEINDLRKAVRLQEWLENTARAGSRYIEQILSHFGVRSSDSRLQRPEYLSGGKTPVSISEVLQNSATIVDGGEPHANIPPSPQGNMAGHGIAVGKSHGCKRSFEEHGLIIGIMSILPRTAYQQGLHKLWSRSTKFDYYWPEFANLGEQQIHNKEVYFDFAGATAQAEQTFGYTSRFSEYKYANSRVCGDFRDNLAYWHLGRIFEATPALNAEFVEADPSTRIFNVTDPTEDPLWVQVYHKVDALRPMPYYGTPTL